MATVHFGRLVRARRASREPSPSSGSTPQYAKDPEFVAHVPRRGAPRVAHPAPERRHDARRREHARTRCSSSWSTSRARASRSSCATRARPGSSMPPAHVAARHRGRAPRPPRRARGEERTARAAQHRPPRRLPAERARRHRRHGARARLRRRQGRDAHPVDPRRADEGQAQLHVARAAQRQSPSIAVPTSSRPASCSGRRSRGSGSSTARTPGRSSPSSSRARCPEPKNLVPDRSGSLERRRHEGARA